LNWDQRFRKPLLYPFELREQNDMAKIEYHRYFSSFSALKSVRAMSNVVSKIKATTDISKLDGCAQDGLAAPVDFQKSHEGFS
jgi:hypothetical protein